MDFEQKYKHAIENIKKIKKANKGNKALIDFIEYEYPELKESYDEKMWNSILEGLIDCRDEFDYFGGAPIDELISWVEKQDPKKFEKELEKAYKCADEVQYRNGYEAAKREIEKQGEQNPVDKVEPKIKIEKDKWYVCNTARYRDFIVGKVYYCPKNGMLKPNENEIAQYVASDCFRLWTIQDAKDGDVLAAPECIVLFKEIDGLNIKCYCTYHFMNNQGIYTNTLQNKTAFHPATKEQQSMLIQKLKEIGWSSLISVMQRNIEIV